MVLTRSFKTLVRDRAEREPAFRAALFAEALESLLAADLPTARSQLRDFVNATLGFERLAERTGLPVKSLMRMFGPRGNPTAANLFAVIEALRADQAAVITVDVTISEPAGATGGIDPQDPYADFEPVLAEIDRRGVA